MKNKVSLAAVLLLVVGIVFLSKNDAVSSKSNSTAQSLVQDTISVKTFKMWTNAWQNQGQQYCQNNKMQYFTSPRTNFSQILATNAVSVRSYMGLDTTVIPAIAHLIFVGVDAAGQDMVDYSNGLYYYNFSDLCPDNCPQK